MRCREFVGFLLVALVVLVSVSAVPAKADATDVSAETPGASAAAPSSNSEAKSPADPKAAQPAEAKSQTPAPPGTASGGAKPAVADKTPTFIPGMRIQARYTYDSDSGKQTIFVQRLRFKARGDLFGVARYGIEIKIDNLGKLETDPRAELENAWVEFPVKPALTFRIGLFDVPFSRNALTSDSRLLLMDRSLIKDALTSLGMADNTVGFLAHGRPFKGRLEYGAGVFNNLQFKGSVATGTRRSDTVMPAGRIAFNFLDPAPQGGYGDYQSSYLGQGKRLTIGAHTAYLRRAHDGPTEFDLYGSGVDAFFCDGPVTLEAEYDRFRREMFGADPNIQGAGWYAQAGYLVWRRVWELTFRHQQLDPDVRIANNELKWTSVGFNHYIRAHSLKVQLDYTFRRGAGQAVKTDFLQIQLQADF